MNITRTKLLNKTFSRLKVESFAFSKQNKNYWNCQCICGNKCIASTGDLNQGKTISCGCKRKEGRKRTTNIQEKFEKSFIVNDNGCWIWQLSLNNSGYGYFCINGVGMGAHRASKIIYENLDLTNKHACHKCDTPSCVNPSHIWVGDAKANMQDAILKNRNYSQINPKARQAEKNGNSKLTWLEVNQIRKSNKKQILLAQEYNVSPSAISSIKRNITWKALK